jgi:phosphopantothenoylcysteine decarboxylase/phosphopantothenate--cysteine ligase
VLAGRRILVGVSGGVAAYKSAVLARRLLERGAEVRVVMTESALQFLGAQTMAAITGHAPVTSLFGGPSVSPHTELGRWAEAVVVAPATAATMARLATGLSDDALSATVAATTAPVLIAPAMHAEMWAQPSTRRNAATLEADGRILIGPASGPLAGGDSGPGRMVEPEEIVAALESVLGGGPLEGWRVVVSAGGTREPLDPVRYLGNRSSGKMGAAVADEAARLGARVVLVTAGIDPADRRVEVVRVETAEEMAAAVWERAAGADVAVLAAAVADFRPRSPAPSKLRRADGPPPIELEPTPDILAGVAAMEPRPFLVGFAAETGPPEQAAAKAASKGVDLLVANDVTEPGSGFGTDTNRVVLIRPDGAVEPWEPAGKRAVAARLWQVVAGLRSGGQP